MFLPYKKTTQRVVLFLGGIRNSGRYTRYKYRVGFHVMSAGQYEPQTKSFGYGSVQPFSIGLWCFERYERCRLFIAHHKPILM